MNESANAGLDEAGNSARGIVAPNLFLGLKLPKDPSKLSGTELDLPLGVVHGLNYSRSAEIVNKRTKVARLNFIPLGGLGGLSVPRLFVQSG